MSAKEIPLIKDQTILGEYRVIGKLNTKSKNTLYKVENLNGNDECIDTEQNSYYIDSKIMKAIPYDSAAEKYYFDQEDSIMSLLRKNDLFVTYDDSFEEIVNVMYIDELGNSYEYKKNYKFMIMKHYKHTDLENELQLCQCGMNEENIIRVLYQALKALIFLKDNCIVHHDIKLGNFLVISIDPFKVALTDFEFAEVLSDDQGTMLDLGTPIYMSPEILKKVEHGFEVDMWSLGMCAYRLSCKSYPFKLHIKDSYNELCYKVENNTLAFPRIDFKKKSPLLKQLISRMLNKNQDERISAEEALQDSLFEKLRMNDQQDVEDVE